MLLCSLLSPVLTFLPCGPIKDGFDKQETTCYMCNTDFSTRSKRDFFLREDEREINEKLVVTSSYAQSKIAEKTLIFSFPFRIFELKAINMVMVISIICSDNNLSRLISLSLAFSFAFTFNLYKFHVI